MLPETWITPSLGVPPHLCDAPCFGIPVRGACATCAWQSSEVPSEKEGFRKFHSSSMWESPFLVSVSCCIGASWRSRYHLMGSVVPPPQPTWNSLAHPTGISTPEKGKEHFLTPLGAPCPRLCWVLCPYGRAVALIRSVPAAVCARHWHCRAWHPSQTHAELGNYM